MDNWVRGKFFTHNLVKLGKLAHPIYLIGDFSRFILLKLHNPLIVVKLLDIILNAFPEKFEA